MKREETRRDETKRNETKKKRFGEKETVNVEKSLRQYYQVVSVLLSLALVPRRLNIVDKHQPKKCRYKLVILAQRNASFLQGEIKITNAGGYYFCSKKEKVKLTP